MEDNNQNPQSEISFQHIVPVGVDPDGNIYKDGKLSICPYAPKIPYEKDVAGLRRQGGFSPDNYAFHTFPCTTKCPKANILSVVKDEKHVGFILEISCGTMNQYDLAVEEKPAEEPRQEPGKALGMRSV